MWTFAGGVASEAELENAVLLDIRSLSVGQVQARNVVLQTAAKEAVVQDTNVILRLDVDHGDHGKALNIQVALKVSAVSVLI